MNGKIRFKIISMVVCLSLITTNCFGLQSKTETEVKAVAPVVAVAVGVPVIASLLVASGIVANSGNDMTAIANNCYRNMTTDMQGSFNSLGSQVKASGLASVIVGASLLTQFNSFIQGHLGTAPTDVALKDVAIGNAYTTTATSVTDSFVATNVPHLTYFAAKTYGTVYTYTWGETTVSYNMSTYGDLSTINIVTASGVQYRLRGQLYNHTNYATGFQILKPYIYCYGTASPQVRFACEYVGGMYPGRIETFGSYVEKLVGASWVSVGYTNLYNDMCGNLTQTTGTASVNQTTYNQTINNTTVNDTPINVSRDISSIASMTSQEITNTENINNNVLDQTAKLVLGFQGLLTAISELPNQIKTALTALFGTVTTAITTAVTNIQTTINAIPSAVSTAMSSSITAVKTAVDSVQGVCANIKTAVDTLVLDAGTIINTSFDSVIEAVQSVPDVINLTLENVIGAINTGIDSVVGALGNVVGGTLEWTQSLADGIVQAIKDALEWAFVPSDTFWIEKFNEIKLPIMEKFPQNITILNALAVGGDSFNDISMSAFYGEGNQSDSAVVVKAKYINDNIEWLRSATSCIWLFLLFVYVWKRVNGLLAGTNDYSVSQIRQNGGF
jgi:hypothetical protein